ncbi:MAG: hypothetical protein ACD_47C00052G0002 [uncultured bacterium]|uniref:HAD family hydrolase n=1 Tax=Candidatus Wallbacteria bacterium GWC2_49_35 TaxID=1817813 RepID=A0A1F7WLM5_9BACT|nr:MAG: hypothetical protein ACD_47C00052G0002 [uncultured bacterium]OGM03752.1 MAG: hypothetical protein A2008_08855 [Candidatus Wallbacteria bacterium GWC2_49_35]HBC75596.1 hypothetical protein [Candidatus Wallbacteria bacterium]
MNAKYHSAVFIDIDGTLVGRDSVIPESAAEAIVEAQREGFMIVLTTGRMYRSAVKEAARVNISADSPVISFNGAFVAASGDANDVIHYEPIGGALFKELVAALEKFERKDITIFCYNPFELFVDRENELLAEYVKRTGAKYNLADSFAGLGESPKVLALTGFETPELLLPFRDAIDKTFRGRLEYVNSFPNYLEITSAGVSKGLAIEKVAARFGIDASRTYAIGDSFNDVQMFRAAAVSIAMGNSDDAVKKQAAFVTKRLEEDGIYYAFKNFILK